MLKALIWKEWRETRLFLFIMATGVFPVSLILKSLEQNNNDILAFLYVIIWIFFAVLLSASQFSNEAKSGTLDFLLSRPTHWFKIWLIKTLYGICALTVFSFFLLLLGSFFIQSLTESATLVQNFFKSTPSSTPPVPFIGISLFTIILSLYFIGCIVSIIIKSPLKAALVAFLISGFLYFIMLCSSLLLNFTSSNYIFWIIFPVLLFITFLRYQPYFYIRKVSYWTLSIGGALFWIIFASKGISLLILSVGARHNYSYTLSPSNALISFLLISFVISSILASIFAFGIHQKKYPSWWKSISSFNLVIIFTICTTAVLLETIPSQKHIGLAANSLSPIVICHDMYIKIPLLYKGKFPYMVGRVSYQYLTVNEDNGEVHSLGHGKFMFNDIDVSNKSQWALYSCPALRWGVYYTWELWAENLITNRKYLLMTRNNAPGMGDIEEEWFDNGSRLIILDRGSNKKTLFSVKNGTPQKIKEEQEPGKSWLLHIDINNKLYFYNSSNGIISCYNHELTKEYELSVVKDKMIEIISDYFQNEESSHYKDRTDINFDNFTTVERDGTIKPRANNNVPYVFYYGPEFSISPDGKHMIFYLRFFSKTGKSIADESKNWCVSLPDGIYNKEVKLRNTHLNSYRWIPGTGRVLDSYRRGNKVDLIDFKKGIRKNIIKGNFYYIQNKFPIESSDNGTYILTYGSSNTVFEKTVTLYRVDSETLTCSYVSSKTDLAHSGIGTLQKWSSDHSQVAFRDSDTSNIWQLDLNKGKWSEIKCPFKYYSLLGVSNKGEVYVAPLSDAKIYRLTETGSEIIFEGW